FDDVGCQIISAGMDTDQIPRVMKLTMRELKQFTEKPPSAKEMRRTKDFLLGQIDISLESTENQMMWLGDQLIGYGRIIPPSRIKRRLSEVQPGQIRAVAREFLRPQNMNLALISPLKSNTGLAKML